MVNRDNAGSGLNPQSSILNPARSAYPHPIIAREGWPFIAVSVAVAVLVHWWAGIWWAALPWLVVAFMVQFFRDPPRAVPQEPKAVLSPADGRIVALEIRIVRATPSR